MNSGIRYWLKFNMNKLLGKIYCFFKGHDEWDGITAIAIGHPKLGNNFVSVEYCTRCQTLWGNHLKKKAVAQIQNVLNQMAKPVPPTPIPTLLPDADTFLQEFVLDEEADIVMSVWVGQNRLLSDVEIEVECTNGKIVAYTLDFPIKPFYEIDEVDTIREQIGSVLNKIDSPRKIVVSPKVKDLFNFDFGKSNGIVGYGSQHQNWTIVGNSNGQSSHTQGVNAQGTVQSQSSSGNGISGIGGGNKL